MLTVEGALRPHEVVYTGRLTAFCLRRRGPNVVSKAVTQVT
jgi:hypothetical protein